MSIETPATALASGALGGPSTSANSASVHNPTLMPRSPSAARTEFGVGERQRPVADDLAGFMTLAGDHQRVAAAQHADGDADRLRAIADFARAWRGGQNGGADGGGLLGARVVVGDDDDVGAASGDRPHHRAFAGIAVAAATEHHDQASLHERTQRREGLFQRVGLVRVIDEDRGAASFADAFQPARRALQHRQR